MNDSRTLTALLAAIAPLGLATSGCGSSLVDFTERVCLVHSDGLSNLAPSADIDFVALRMQTNAGTPTIVSQWGTPCQHAANPDQCMAALDALPFGGALATTGIDFLTSYDVAFTRGDAAETVTTRAALLDVLGPIDMQSEAVLLAFADGYEMPCDEENVRLTSDGFVLLGTRGNTCGGDIEHFEIIVTAAGETSVGESEVVEEGDPNCAIGRRPAALRSRTTRGRSLGQFFANAAHLEAASVHAFEQLARELAAHGAPRRLVREARRSRADEVRHTLATAAMARRFGGRPVRPVVGPRAARSLFDVALDNATEGCVRETFGALVATVQAMGARDAHVRRSLRRIAVDETRHAALSWAIDAWARRRLPPRSRRELDEARRSAVASLRGEVAREWSEDVIEIAGMPRAEASLRMVARLESTLWTG